MLQYLPHLFWRNKKPCSFMQLGLGLLDTQIHRPCFWHFIFFCLEIFHEFFTDWPYFSHIAWSVLDFALPLDDSELIDIIVIVLRLSFFLKWLLCVSFLYLGPKTPAEDMAGCSSLKFLLLVGFNIVGWIAHFSFDVRDISVEENLL